jgi:hypothetical protein
MPARDGPDRSRHRPERFQLGREAPINTRTSRSRWEERRKPEQLWIVSWSGAISAVGAQPRVKASTARRPFDRSGVLAEHRARRHGAAPRAGGWRGDSLRRRKSPIFSSSRNETRVDSARLPMVTSSLASDRRARSGINSVGSRESRLPVCQGGRARASCSKGDRSV